MKETLIAGAIALLIIIGAFAARGNRTVPENNVPVQNVSVVDGIQLIDLTARGGYSPLKSTAQAGIPTLLRFNTSGTYDCSSIVRIPSMDIDLNLPPTGVTEVDLGSPKAGILNGSCGMGMYPFQIEFQ